MDTFTEPALNALSAAVARLSGSDRSFAESLLSQAASRPLSDKQMFWVRELTGRASQPKPAPVDIGEMAGILRLFDTAQKHLKRPAIVLQVAGVGEVRISRAGVNARVPGSLNVSENAPYGVGRWFGRVLTSGQFETRGCAPDGLVEGLKAFAEDPAGVASEHGRMTGRCCFCNSKLTDERSTGVGYGQTCAKHFGLPWGAKVPSDDLFARAL
ncbi:DUF6011 domain-containing protein [Chelatococcus asaccharovorans]|uniref:Uncharacterized protein n=1 Tax=Chelatococcus asaccharovorans TaxID=28210 RepID=A0A2V3UBY2_9HYPH|nr:DUF6011 domain-containing protein [Chelatococcus asaccharovorans]MBS7703295.1 hypothetical protein [Chelatococcus asaccharovorans]PXW61628.1 hypothetical protein C7450_103145 [Chelatococcus asaccharovorans]